MPILYVGADGHLIRGPNRILSEVPTYLKMERGRRTGHIQHTVSRHCGSLVGDHSCRHQPGSVEDLQV